MLLQQADDDRFLTAVFARLRHTLGGVAVTIACSGHPFPYVVRRDGSIESVGKPGTLLGMLATVSVTDVEIMLRPGETLVLYTDGLTEARGPSGFLGDRGLQDVLRSAAGLSAGAMADEIIRRLRVHHGVGEAVDDVAVLVIGVPARSPQSSRRRMGWSGGTSMMRSCAPSGSVATISRRPHGIVTGGCVTATPASTRRACSASTSGTCSHSTSASPGPPDRLSSRKPPPRKNTMPVITPPAPNSRCTAQPERLAVKTPRAVEVQGREQHAVPVLATSERCSTELGSQGRPSMCRKPMKPPTSITPTAPMNGRMPPLAEGDQHQHVGRQRRRGLEAQQRQQGDRRQPPPVRLLGADEAQQAEQRDHCQRHMQRMLQPGEGEADQVEGERQRRGDRRQLQGGEAIDLEPDLLGDRIHQHGGGQGRREADQQRRELPERQEGQQRQQEGVDDRGRRARKARPG